MGFVEAVRDLAQQAGLDRPRGRPVAARNARQAAALKQRQASADRCAGTRRRGPLPQAAQGQHARHRLPARARPHRRDRRGASASATRPTAGAASASAFRHYDDPLLEESGLRDLQGDDEADKKRYDRFRDRIMFPIRNGAGRGHRLRRARARQGRAQVPELARDPGVPQGQRALRPARGPRRPAPARATLLVVEGYMDVVALAQLGFPNAVATLGTACRPTTCRSCSGFTETIVVQLRRRRRRPTRRGPRARGLAAVRQPTPAASRFLFLPPSTTPTPTCASTAPRTLRAVRRPGPCRCRAS